MMQNLRSRIFVISSPSGGGKTTLVQRLLTEREDLTYSISATTRQPRRGEKHGVDYLFLGRDAFQESIQENAFLEWAEVHGNLYGTLKCSVQELLDQHKSVILDIDVQGGLEIKKSNPETVLIFIMPPSLEILKERLTGRGTDDVDNINRRLDAAKQEMKIADQYDYIVFNHELDTAYADLSAVIDLETRVEP